MRHSIAVTSVCASAAIFLASCTQDQPTEIRSLKPGGKPPLANAVGKKIPGQYIVRLRDDVHMVAQVATTIAAAHGGTVRRVYTHAIKGFSVQIPDAAAAALAKNPQVLYVEQNGYVRAIAEQAGATWGIDRVDQRDLPLNGTYVYNATGDGVDAYIIDTGVRFTHAEFGGRAVSGPDLIDYDDYADDCYGHGTHVAGTLGGATYGVAKNVRIISVRVLSCEGWGTYEGVIAGVDWVTGDHQAGQPAVANMSLGGWYFQALNDALTASIDDGVVYAVAAGNSADDACNYSPASTPAALTVGATDISDTEAWFSNFGSCLDIWAPGVDVTSAWIYDDNSTELLSGTSMATPHVAGGAALYLQGHPTATAADVRNALSSNATAGKILYTGFISASAPPAPAAPNGLTATAVSFWQVSLAWRDNANNENAFRIERCQDIDLPCTDFSVVGHVGSNTQSFQDNTVSGSSAYRYRVTAYNSGGNSDYSNEAAAATPAPPPPPAAPTGLTATAVSMSQIDLAWSDNSTDEDYFVIERCQDLDAPCTDFVWIASTGADDSHYQDFWLNHSSTYRYRVRAVNVGGTSGYSSEEVATTLPPPPPPNAPSALTATAVSMSQIDLAWSDNSTTEDYFVIGRCQDFGSPCTDFIWIAWTGADDNHYQDFWRNPSSTYRYRVVAVNAGGNSDYSNEAVATTLAPPPPPNAPSGLTASAVSLSQINIAWSDNSGDEDGFRVERCTGAGCTNFAQIAQVGAGVTSFNNGGLSSGTTYRYRVRAFSRWGDSGYSNEAGATTVNQLPDARYSWSCKNGACTFDGTSSLDPDPYPNRIVSYAWNFGDGKTGTGATTSHTYNPRVTYSVTLTVTDNAGGVGSRTCTVSAINGKAKTATCP